jgi:hypothetical protein
MAMIVLIYGVAGAAAIMTVRADLRDDRHSCSEPKRAADPAVARCLLLRNVGDRREHRRYPGDGFAGYLGLIAVLIDR